MNSSTMKEYSERKKESLLPNTVTVSKEEVDRNDELVLQKLTDLVLSQPGFLVRSCIDSYNAMIENLSDIIKTEIHIQLDENDPNSPSVIFHGREVRFVHPKMDDKLITASTCLYYRMSYYVSIEAKFDQTIIRNSQSQNTIQTDWIEMTKLPIMVGSNLCVSTCKGKLYDPLFSREDAGGYFILKGNKKAIFYKPRLKFNEILVVPRGKTASSNEEALSINELEVNIISKRAYSYPSYQHFLIISCDQSVVSLNISTLSPDKSYNIFSVIKGISGMRDIDIIEYLLNDVYLRNVPEETYSLITVTLQDSLRNIIDENTIDVIKYSIAHLNEEDNKSEFLLYCIRKLLRVALRFEPVDVRDSYNRTKLMDTPGSLVEELFISYMKITKKMMRDKIRNQPVIQEVSLLSELRIFQSEYMLKFFISNEYWGTSKKKHVCELIQPMNYLSQLESLRKITEDEKEKNKIIEKRRSHTDYQGFICSITSPTSPNIGLHKFWALFGFSNAYVYRYHPNWMKVLREYMSKLQKSNLSASTEETRDAVYSDRTVKGGSYDLFLDGVILGQLTVEGVQEACKYIDKVKFSDIEKYGEFTVTYVDYTRLTLNVNTHGGRILVPVVKLKENRVPVHYGDIHGMTELSEFTSKYPGVLDYVDTHWVDHNSLSMSLSDIKEYNREIKENYGSNASYKFSAVHLSPYAQYSISIALNPFASYQAAVRNLHVAKHLVSSITCNPAMEYNSQEKTRKHLIRGSRPLTRGPIDAHLGVDNMPVVVQMYLEMSSDILTQEDSYLMNWNAIARGALAIYEYKTYEMYVSFKSDEKFNTPTTKNRYFGFNFSKLDSDGIVMLNAEVEHGDVLMCKVESVGDDSVHVMPKVEIYDQYSPGRVCKIERYKNDTEAREYVIVKICKTSLGDAADKLSTDQGQKGVIGQIVSASEFAHNDMNFICSIKCSASAHTRMTGGQLMQPLTNYYAVINGNAVVNNTFDNLDINNMRDYLESHGMDRNQLSRVYREDCGFQLLNSVYVAPISFRRMRQLADNGSVKKADSGIDPITRNPLKGKNSGIKLGRMENDALEIYGVSDYMQSIINYNDKYRICNTCGIRVDVPQCPICKSSSNLMRVKIPAALGAVIEMCRPLGIGIKMRVDPSTTVL